MNNSNNDNSCAAPTIIQNDGHILTPSSSHQSLSKMNDMNNSNDRMQQDHGFNNLHVKTAKKRSLEYDDDDDRPVMDMDILDMGMSMNDEIPKDTEVHKRVRNEMNNQDASAYTNAMSMIQNNPTLPVNVVQYTNSANSNTAMAVEQTPPQNNMNGESGYGSLNEYLMENGCCSMPSVENREAWIEATSEFLTQYSLQQVDYFHGS